MNTEKELIEKIKKDILKEINHRDIGKIAGFGISIKEAEERKRKAIPIELCDWIKYYFKKLGEK